MSIRASSCAPARFLVANVKVTEGRAQTEKLYKQAYHLSLAIRCWSKPVRERSHFWSCSKAAVLDAMISCNVLVEFTLFQPVTSVHLVYSRQHSFECLCSCPACFAEQCKSTSLQPLYHWLGLQLPDTSLPGWTSMTSLLPWLGKTSLTFHCPVVRVPAPFTAL